MLWAGFIAGVVVMVAVDLIANRNQEISLLRALAWTLTWIGLSVAFGFGLYWQRGSDDAVAFFTAYVVEFALSVDNLFVFIVIFTAFKVSKVAQHKLLYWGIAGALVFRFAFIAAGAQLIKRFDWILYILSVFLIFTGVRLALTDDDNKSDPADNAVLRFAQRHLRVATEDHGTAFFAREAGRLVATKLVLVLLAIETADIMFAFDSIPAVLGITQDTFIAFASNACAVLGLRSLFFLVSGLLTRLRYLKYGLAIILTFVGLKIIAETGFHQYLVGYERHILLGSLAFVLLTLVATVVVSMRATAQTRGGAQAHV